jgi:DNA-binding CsgD family transcriptional regulator
LKSAKEMIKRATGPLTDREEQVVIMIASGCSSTQNAKRLKIAFKTAVSHRYRAMKNLEVNNALAPRSAALAMRQRAHEFANSPEPHG